MTLVYTSKDGAAQSQLELSTPSQNVARPVLQELAAILPLPPAVRAVGWNAAAPLVLTLQPAGHAPGFYALQLCVVVRTAAATGTFTRTYQFSTPTFGATQIAGFGAASITALGPPGASFTSVSCYSDGVSALTITLTPAAVTGAPVIDVTAQAVLTGS